MTLAPCPFCGSTLVLAVCERWPNARVWLGDEQVQRGFVAADDVKNLG